MLVTKKEMKRIQDSALTLRAAITTYFAVYENVGKRPGWVKRRDAAEKAVWDAVDESRKVRTFPC